MGASSQQSRPQPVRALGICSGGLDSILSALVLRKQNIEVAWVNFETPFFSSDKARRAARMIGIPLTVRNITHVYIDMLKDPHCGYGGNMNPCLDCHALMLRLAGAMMKEEGFDFLFSGEVLGQRPMSQTKPSLRYVEKSSGFEGYILRPLSAKLMAPTIPEQQGLVDRDRLLDISGRGRKAQMKLAEAFGISDYPAPAGGCLLTDVGFSRRLKDLFAHQDDCQERDFELLKYGRHFRLDTKSKAVVGRTKSDNSQILKLVEPHKDVTISMVDMPGPVVLIPAGASEEVVQQAATLCATYSKIQDDQLANVSIQFPGGLKTVTAQCSSRYSYQSFLI